VNERYAVALRLAGGEVPNHAVALLKRTLRLGPDGASDAPPLALRNDPAEWRARGELPVGSDYWHQKALTDVVVLGEACAPGGKAQHEATASCRVGSHEKRIAVFGRREVRWGGDGKPRIGASEPFERVALSRDNAYGGVDWSVPLPPMPTAHEAIAALADHPGAYARNPFGKGYLVTDAPHDVELPQLEDPDDRLSDERLVVGDPAGWHRQPLPWCLDWLHPMMFPRYRFLGAEGRFESTTAPLAEVDRGWLDPGFRELAAGGGAASAAFFARFFQEASLGLSLSTLAAGTPVELDGMHPDYLRLRFELPEPPALVFDLEGQRAPARARLISVVAEPGHERVSLVYAAGSEPLPRAFLPGVHPRIPVALQVDGGDTARYQAPAAEAPEMRA
jgi:hypothetical protein